MKRKYADKREVSNILTATYKKIDINDDPKYIAATIVDIYEVSDKLQAERRDGRVDTIIDVAYKWITLFLKDEKYVIEVAINAKSEIVEFIFDICKSINHRTYVPSKLDLYLDVCITSRREIEFQGEEALEEAYKMGNISRKNYELAKKTADKIVNRYSKEDELRNLIIAAQKYLARLMAFTESREINRKKPTGFEIEGIKELFGKGDFEDYVEEKPKEKKSFLSKFFNKPKENKEEPNENDVELDSNPTPEVQIPENKPNQPEENKDQENKIKENSVS